MRLNTSPHEHGFTMVEMIVVMLIIAVLTAVAVPMYLNQRNEAHMAALKSDLHSVSQAVAASRAEVKHGFKEPVNINNIAANSIDPDTQIPVRLSKGITLQYEADDDNFCIVGTHESDPTNVWSYSTMRGSVEAYNCITGESSGSDEDGTVVAAPEPTIPIVAPTTAPTTAPTVAPTTAPAPTPTVAPTTPSTPAPTTPPTPAPSNPRLVEHTATHTTSGMILKGKVADVTGDITLRASGNELTGQLGWYLSATPDSNGNFEIELTKFVDSDERFWQLELGNGGSNYGTKLASGTVSPTVNTTDPAVVSYTVRYTSNGATINAVIKNHNGKSLLFRTSNSPIVSQTGYFQIAQVDSNGNFSRQLTGFNKNDSNRYWQLEVSSSGSVHGPVLAKGHVTASNPTNTGP